MRNIVPIYGIFAIFSIKTDCVTRITAAATRVAAAVIPVMFFTFSFLSVSLSYLLNLSISRFISVAPNSFM